MIHKTTEADNQISENTNPDLVTMMRTAQFSGPEKIEIQEVAIGIPGPEEVLVKLEGCGLCGSNLPVWEGRSWFRYPFDPGAPGHEGWGRVEKVGASVKNVKKGDRVTLLSYHAYAEYDLIDSELVVPLPQSLNGRPFPGEPLGCAVNVFERSRIEKNSIVAVVGLGFLGAIITQLAISAGARVIAIGRRPWALDIAKKMGAYESIPMVDNWDVVNKIKKLTNNNMCDVVIEATGYQWPLDLASELTKIRGRLVIAGYHQDGARTVNMQQWNWKGIDVINAHEREPSIYISGIKKAMSMVETGALDPSLLFTHTFSLDTISDAFKMMQTRPDGFMKALVKL